MSQNQRAMQSEPQHYSLAHLVVRRMFQVGLGIGALSVLLSASIIFMNFGSLERAYVADKLHLVQNLMSNEKRLLKAMSFDYGNWEKTYDYLQGKNADFFQNDLREEDISNLHVNAVLFLDQKVQPQSWLVSDMDIGGHNKSNFVYIQSYLERAIEPLLKKHAQGLKNTNTGSLQNMPEQPKGALDNAKKDYTSWGKSVIVKIQVGPKVSGFSAPHEKGQKEGRFFTGESGKQLVRELEPNEHWFLLSFAPVLSYDVPQKHGGWVVFLRHMDQDYVQTLRERVDVQFNFDFVPEEQEQKTYVINSSKNVLKMDSKFKKPMMLEQKEGVFHAWMPIDESPSVLIHAQVPMRWGAERMQTVMTVAASSTLLLLGLLVFAYGWLHKTILIRLEGFSKSIQQRVSGSDILLPVQDKNSDEIDALAGSINQMIRQVKQAQLELEYRSEHDSLTRLANRRKLWSHLERIQQSIKGTSSDSGARSMHSALMVLDLDGFKQINDQYGHHAGDVLLQYVAFVLRQKVAHITDGVYRLGGDEFALLVQTQDIKSVLGYLKTVIHTLNAGVSYAQHTLQVGACVGVYWIDLQKVSQMGTTDWMAYADEALYLAKSHGKNTLVMMQEDKSPQLVYAYENSGSKLE